LPQLGAALFGMAGVEEHIREFVEISFTSPYRC
jgi:hypothetical protein